METYLSSASSGTYVMVSKTPRQVVADLLTDALGRLGTPLGPACTAPIASICPNYFTQTQLNKIVAGMTVSQVDNIFGCTGRSQNGGYAYLWYNDLSLFDPTMDYATVLFTNGVYQGGPSTKYIIGPVFP